MFLTEEWENLPPPQINQQKTKQNGDKQSTG